jgi:hypothetical protein
MRTTAFTLFLGIFLVVGCSTHTTLIVVESTLSRVKYVPSKSPNPFSMKDGVGLTVEPTPFPESFSVGDGLVVNVSPILETGVECEQCRIQWHTSDQDVARWTVPATPCSHDRCANLRILGSGEAKLTVEVCPGHYQGCIEFEIAKIDCEPSPI